jgi:hypothetical protein
VGERIKLYDEFGVFATDAVVVDGKYTPVDPGEVTTVAKVVAIALLRDGEYRVTQADGNRADMTPDELWRDAKPATLADIESALARIGLTL